MFGMGMGEIILIAVVALLVLGPDRLPSAAKTLGKAIRDLRSQTKDLQQTIEKDTELGDAVRELRGALRGDPETLYERATGQRFSDLTGSSKPALGSKASESTSTHDSEGETDSEGDGLLADPHGDAPSSSAAPEAGGEHTSAPPAGAAESDLPAADAAGSDPFEPVIRSAEGAVARSAASSSDDPSNG